MSSKLRPFHLALPVKDLGDTLQFYTNTLGCDTGRTATRWADLDFFGHQVTLHLVDSMTHVATNPVDGDDVPALHHGVILTPAEWQRLAKQLVDQGCQFIIEPHTRFEGQVGEQSTMFLLDPSGNALEFKSFADDGQIFSTSE